MFRVPTPNRRMRLLVMGYGLLLFLWLTPEDQQVLPVTLLGLGMAGLGMSLTVMKRLGGRMIAGRMFVLSAIIAGVVIGLGGSIAIAALMFFKNALHAHLYFDFPVPMMLAMLESSPAWGLAGGFVGLGAALAWLALRQETHESGHEYR
jgi:hypothetical protein